jgi:hypothetical protein
VTDPSHAAPSIEQRIAHAAMGIAYSRLLLSVVFTLGVSILFVGLLLPYFPLNRLGIWLLIIQTVGLMRLGLLRWYRRSEHGFDATGKWTWLFLIGSIAAAASWSIGAVLLTAPTGSLAVAMLCVTLLAVSSVAVSSLSAHFPSLLAFLITCLGPIAVTLMRADTAIERVIGYALVAAVVALGWTGWQSTRVLGQLLRAEFELNIAIDQTRR